MTPEFKSFPDIKKLSKSQLVVTQKIHGSNAQIFIYQTEDGSLDLAVGSRTKWIVLGADNFGFAQMVYENKQEFIDKLGVGRHYGEWAGPGINSGEGLTEKTFILFDHWKYPPERPLPPHTTVVPVLYTGPFDLQKVEDCMADLKANGSKLVPGFMRPEGVVVNFAGTRYKKVFEKEDTKWDKADPKYQKQKNDDDAKALELYGHLLQPIRLEKLLSRDEKYLIEYPKNMKIIVEDYFTDLVKEDQLPAETSDLEIKGIKNLLARNLYKFVREGVERANGSISN